MATQLLAQPAATVESARVTYMLKTHMNQQQTTSNAGGGCYYYR